jgi:hypothetical protein
LNHTPFFSFHNLPVSSVPKSSLWKAINRLTLIDLTRPQDGRREVRFVRTVGKRLRFETEARLLDVRDAVLASQWLDELARVELNAGLGGEHFHDPPARRLGEPRGETQFAALAAHDPIVVVEAAAGTRADACRVRKVKVGAVDGGDLAGRNQAVGHRCVKVRLDLHMVVHDRGRNAQIQIEEAVVRQIDDCRLVGRGSILDVKRRLAVRQFIRHRALDRARIALVVVGRRVRENQRGAARRLDETRGPQRTIPAVNTTVQMIGTIVARQLIGVSVDVKATESDAIRVPSDRTAVVGTHTVVLLKRVESEHNVSAAHVQRDNGAAPVAHAQSQARLCVLDSVEMRSLTVDCSPNSLLNGERRHIKEKEVNDEVCG